MWIYYLLGLITVVAIGVGLWMYSKGPTCQSIYEDSLIKCAREPGTGTECLLASNVEVIRCNNRMSHPKR